MPGDYIVQKIIGKRVKNGNDIQYKVKWQGYDSSQNTWEPLKHLKNVSAMLKNFQKRNQEKLNQFSNTLRESNQKMNKQLRKKTFNKKSLKKVHNSRMSKEEQKQAQRQSLRTIKKSQIEEKISRLKSKPLLRKDDNDSDVQMISPPNRQLEKNRIQQPSQLPGFEINFDSIAKKIIKAVKEKQQIAYKIIGLVKAKTGKPDMFLVQDSQAKFSHQTRQYVLKNLPLQLIVFYQDCIEFDSQKK